MSYLKTYRTPKACYKKAPVRRETMFEAAMRTRHHVLINREANMSLTPGKASYIKDVTYGQYR